jgi:transposase
MSAILGIDVAKDSFDVQLLRSDAPAETAQFDNTRAGFQKLARFLKKRRVQTLHACLEATGRYGEELALFLYQQQFSVSVVNPYRIKAYATSQLQRNKTDRLDAALIADFCRTQQPPLWTPPPPEWWELRQLVRHLEDLQQDRQRQHNRQLAGSLPLLVQANLTEQLTLLDTQIAQVKRQIDDHLNQHPDLKRQADLLDTIPGLGRLTIAKLLAEFRDLSAFASVKQLVAFAGLNPRHRQSGTSVRGATTISKLGCASIRAALYMPAVVAKRFNPLLRTFALRLESRGLRPLQVVVAVMRKLLHLVYGVLKSGRPFDPDYPAHRLALS